MLQLESMNSYMKTEFKVLKIDLIGWKTAKIGKNVLAILKNNSFLICFYSVNVQYFNILFSEIKLLQTITYNTIS